MRPVIIPKDHNNLDIEFYLGHFKYIKSDYLLNFETLYNIIKNLSSINIITFYFIVFKILKSNSLTPPIFPKPQNGIQLLNKKDGKPYGIYHTHLHDEYILIWYITWYNDGKVLHFECLKHPQDDYKSIIKNIYNRNDNGFNLELDEYFYNLGKLINESKIMKWRKFLKNRF